MYSRLHNVCRNQKATNVIIIVRVSSGAHYQVPTPVSLMSSPLHQSVTKLSVPSCVKLLIKELLEELYVPL